MHATVLAGCLLALIAVPDVLLPGHRAVRHEIEFTWDEGAALPRLVLGPIRGLHGHAVVRRGEPCDFSSKYGTRLYAVPAGAELPESIDPTTAAGWPSCNMPVQEVASMPAGHPLEHIVTMVRVVRVRPDGIDLEVTGHRRYGALGLEFGAMAWLPLAVLALAGAGWLHRLDRRARAAGSAP